jgi:hypothetical protein
MPKKQHKHDPRVKPGFSRRSNAICVVVYDLQGNPLAPETARKVLKAVTKATEDTKYAIEFTQE